MLNHAVYIKIMRLMHAISLTDTAPTDITVTVICSKNAENPDVQVEWKVSQL